MEYNEHSAQDDNQIATYRENPDKLSFIDWVYKHGKHQRTQRLWATQDSCLSKRIYIVTTTCENCKEVYILDRVVT